MDQRFSIKLFEGIRRLGLCALLAAPFAWTAVAQFPSPAQIRTLSIPRIEQKPSLEEFLNGNSRSDMMRVDDFRQRQPGDGEPISYPTSAFLGYDDANLYVVFVCKAPVHEIRARIAKREDIFTDDWVAVVLDTWHDYRRGYEFFVTPLGVQADALEGEGMNEDFSFDTLWYSDGRITEDGYISTFTLPFKSLRFPSEQKQTWGLALGRYIPRKSEKCFWPHISGKINGFNRQFGEMEGLESISAGRNLQFMPYAAFGTSHFLDDPSGGVPGYRSTNDFRGGMDIKAVIHDSFTVDVAVNPDFSQVETDDPQVTVNQRYEVKFAEKRPFFLENSGFFATPENLFFSRRIADPEFGGRLTGKAGPWSLGFLAMDDRAAGRDLAVGDPRRGERATIGIARASREISKNVDIGLLFTNREYAGGFNRVAAVDSRLKMGKVWSFAGQVIGSITRDLDGLRTSGDALNLDLNAVNRKYNYELTYIDRGEGFHTDLGYIPRAGIRQVTQYARRTFRPNGGVLLSYGPRVNMKGVLDRAGVQQDWLVTPGFQMEMRANTIVVSEHSQAFERYNGVNFRKSSYYNGFHTEYLKWATFDIVLIKGRGINYDAPDSMRPFAGDETDWQFELSFRPASRLRLDQIYYYTRFQTRPDSFPGAPSRPITVFTNHLARSRANYQFTRRLSLRLILDYNAVLSNTSLTTLEREKRVGGDALLTYLLHPGTAFYVGYSDRLENLALRHGPAPELYRTGSPNATTGRQFFVKISYLLRL